MVSPAYSHLVLLVVYSLLSSSPHPLVFQHLLPLAYPPSSLLLATKDKTQDFVHARQVLYQ